MNISCKDGLNIGQKWYGFIHKYKKMKEKNKELNLQQATIWLFKWSNVHTNSYTGDIFAQKSLNSTCRHFVSSEYKQK